MIAIKSSLKVLRAKKNITQEELAKELTLDKKFINRLENGKVKSINVANLSKLSEFFDYCPMDELMRFDFEKAATSGGQKPNKN